MAEKTSASRLEGESDTESAIPRQLIAQAQAAASQIDKERLRQPSADADQNPPQAAPPPPYSKVYGHLDLHESGLNTLAQVSDDGRLDIHITEESRIVTNVLVPALRKQLDIQQNHKATHLASDSSQQAQHRTTRPPALSIVIHVVGSRGDVQPFVALGKELKAAYGHRIRLATHSHFREFVVENGLEFFSIGGDPAELMAFMVKNPGLMPGKDALRKGEIGKRRKGMHDIIHGCWRSCFESGDGTGPPVSDAQSGNDFNVNDKPFVADAIIANPPSFAHLHCAEKMGIPLHLMFTMPWSPTQSFPHPLANIQESSTEISVTNFLSYALVELMTWQGLGDLVNSFREKTLGLEPLSLMWAPGMVNRLRVPYTYCWSPLLIPKPRDWGMHISVSGFYFLSLAGDYTPAAELEAFLTSGPPPVYIGFGSIVVDEPNAMTQLIFEAIKKSGQRALVSKGWGGLGANSLDVPDNIFMLGNVPHDWLFKRVSCVVHHGGAGTTAAGIALGKPTIVVPFFGDQPFWGAMVAKAGAGPNPIHNKALSADNLADAISFALKPSVLERAKELGERIIAENGTKEGAKSFHEYLDLNSMRCSLSPARAAVWSVKRKGIQLSAFAATVLADANLLDFGDLELHRSKEYDTEDTPWDPIGGAASALAGTIGSLMMGVADFPMEILKLFSKRPKSNSDLPQGESNAGAPHAPANNNRPGKDDKPDKAPQNVPVAKSGSIEEPVTMESAFGAGKSVARIVDAGMKSPMDFTLALAKGFHNAPKLYGDGTVRPVEKVTDLKSGIRAAGKGFGYGFYDGISGLVTQPLEGAKKDGLAGFVKGFGKGIGGVVLKPGAAIWGIPGYTSRGIYKELRKLYGSSVQGYIIAARTAQGYEDFKNATDSERLDIISSWNERVTKQSQKQGYAATSSSNKQGSVASSAAVPPLEVIAQGPISEEFEQAIHASVKQTSSGNPEEDAMIERAIRASLTELHQGPSKSENGDDAVEAAIAASLADVSRDSRDNAAGSRSAQDVPLSSGSDKDVRDVDSDNDENMKRALQMSQNEATYRTTGMAHNAVGGVAGMPSHGKGSQEEEIIMQYMLRQSLAEEEFSNNRADSS